MGKRDIKNSQKIVSDKLINSYQLYLKTPSVKSKCDKKLRFMWQRLDNLNWTQKKNGLKNQQHSMSMQQVEQKVLKLPTTKTKTKNSIIP